MDKRLEKYLNMVCGDFIVKEFLGDKTWLCQCQKCGYERTYKTQNLKGKCQCGCTTSGVKKGDKYNRLTALQRDISRVNEGRVFWLWQCDCGNIISRPLKEIKNGNTKSCGCLLKENRLKNLEKIHENQLESLVGKRSGLLQVIRQATKEEIGNRPSGLRYWYCKCDCGNFHIVSTSDFNYGKVQSCGCLNSKGEAKIKQLLENNNIKYATQFYFDDLKTYNNKKFRFDFGVLNDEQQLQYLIEYDGIQHFDEDKQFGSNNKQIFENIQNRDQIKNEYCKVNNIPLIRIPYNHFDKIEIKDLLLETTDFLVKDGDA